MTEVQLAADICQLSLNDVTELAIAYIEYVEIGCNFMDDADIVHDYFDNRSIGYRVIEIIRAQRSEILAYIPRDTVEMNYVSTVGEGVYVYARTSDNVVVG